jgi:hypothetical protein
MMSMRLNSRATVDAVAIAISIDSTTTDDDATRAMD